MSNKRKIVWEKLQYMNHFIMEDEESLENSISPYSNAYISKAWVFHINFKLTEEDINNLINIDGVEKLVPITRYKIVVTIGELFDCRKIKHLVNSCLKIDSFTKTPKFNLDSLVKECQTKNTMGIMFPNGKYQVYNDEEYGYFQKILEAKSVTGGVIVRNNKDNGV